MRVTVGGFVGGYIKDPYFKELLVRWFAWGCFCPYNRECMRQVSLTGAPVMRPLFFLMRMKWHGKQKMSICSGLTSLWHL